MKTKLPEVLTDHEGSQLPKQCCPVCGYDNKAATYTGIGSDGRVNRPMPGDVGVCGSCGEINIFSDLMILQRIPEKVWNSQSEDWKQALLSMQRFIRTVNNR